MKNKILIFVIVFIIILVVVLKIFITEHNKIICTSNGETKDLNINQKYIIKYDKNGIKNMQITKIYKYMDSDRFKKFEVVYNNTLSNYKSLNNPNLDYSGSISKDTYKIELNVDVSKILKKDLENLGFSKDLNVTKSYLENQGLKCK